MQFQITTATLAEIKDRFPGLPGEVIVGELLRAAWKLVCPRNDWKAPISKIVYISCCNFAPEVIAEAVRFMTATEPTLRRLSKHELHVMADGYRKGSAGP